VLDTIGNTPMIRVKSLSEITGCDVLIKCEFANPGGSVKDRVALRIVTDAMKNGTLRKGGVVTEGTAGSTGVSVAMVANALGCEAFLSLPDDAAAEKSQLMRAFGARVEPVRPVAITHENHFVNVARRRAEAAKKNNQKGDASDETEHSREKKKMAVCSATSSRTSRTRARTSTAPGRRFGIRCVGWNEREDPRTRGKNVFSRRHENVRDPRWTRSCARAARAGPWRVWRRF
jgi:cysteine synthase